MKSSQWNVFGTVFLIISLYFLLLNVVITSGFTILSVNSLDTAMAFLINRLSAFLFVIFIGLSIAFYICARFEKKR